MTTATMAATTTEATAAAMMVVAVAAIEITAGRLLGEHGRYRLKRLLGTGGMASVWLAVDGHLGREVAIKVLSDVLALDPDYVARFKREARIAAGLSHPHLVNVFDFAVDGARPYIVMEYVAGGSLAERLRDPCSTAWNPEAVARELLDALAYIHGAGILHRDIKPGNVLIDVDGRARLTDFGIAQPSAATALTRTGDVIGTKRFIAPEVLRGERATERSDLYSCGVLLGACLRPGATPQLHTLVDRLTAEQPEGRPRSAAEAIALLEGPATAATRVVRPDAAVPGAIRIAPRGRGISVRPSRLAVAIAAVVLLATVLIAVAAWNDGHSPASHASRLIPSAPSAPVSRQLQQLDQAISRLAR